MKVMATYTFSRDNVDIVNGAIYDIDKEDPGRGYWIWADDIDGKETDIFIYDDECEVAE